MRPAHIPVPLGAHGARQDWPGQEWVCWESLGLLLAGSYCLSSPSRGRWPALVSPSHPVFHTVPLCCGGPLTGSEALSQGGKSLC